MNPPLRRAVTACTEPEKGRQRQQGTALQQPRPTPHPPREAGLTIVELMVSVLLASILTGGLFFMMSGQQRTYSSQLSNLSMQENIWGAMEYLQAEARRAGYGFTSCGGQVRVLSGGTPVDINAFGASNGINTLAGGITDPLGSDSFSILASNEPGNASMGLRLMQRMPSGADITPLQVNAPGGVDAGDLLVFWQPGSPGLWCSVLQATTDPVLQSSQRYEIQHDSTSPYNPAPGTMLFPPGGYAMGTVVMNLGTSADPRNFAIDRGVDPPQLVTWVQPDQSDLEVVADGIEDMQISWACDQNGDGIFYEGATDTEKRNGAVDEWANNITGDTPPPCVNPVGCTTNCVNVPPHMIRITLIARSASPVMGDKTGFRPAAEDNPGGTVAEDLTATDGLGTYARTVLTSTVTTRNIR